jgi:hypothetical protein
MNFLGAFLICLPILGVTISETFSERIAGNFQLSNLEERLEKVELLVLLLVSNAYVTFRTLEIYF